VTDFKTSLLQTKEFREILDREDEQLGGSSSGGNVVLVLVSSSWGESGDLLRRARKMVSDKMTPLVITLFELAEDEHADDSSSICAVADCGDSGIVQHVEILDGFRIVSTFASTFSRGGSVTGEQLLGSKGQMSV